MAHGKLVAHKTSSPSSCSPQPTRAPSDPAPPRRPSSILLETKYQQTAGEEYRWGHGAGRNGEGTE